MVSFGAAYGLTPMVTRFGYRDAYLIVSFISHSMCNLNRGSNNELLQLMGIYLAIAVLGVPVYLWKARKSAQWSRSN